MMKTTILALVIMTLTCCHCGESDLPFQSREITPEVILKGDLGNDLAIGYFVIRDDLSWKQFIKGINPNGNVVPNPDFTKYMVIAIVEIKTSYSYSVDITKVVENRSNIVITVKNLIQGTAGMPSKPFEIIKIPKIDKTVVFKRE